MKYDLHIAVRIDTPHGGGFGAFQLSRDTQIELNTLGQAAVLLAEMHKLILTAKELGVTDGPAAVSRTSK